MQRMAEILRLINGECKRSKIGTLLLALVFMPAFASAAELIVAVAANVQYAFTDIETAFEKDTGIMISPVIGSSGKFFTQIKNGAPFDVFISADMDYPQKLETEHFTVGPVKIYASGTLVLWTFNDIEPEMGSLVARAVKKVALPSPETAPYGKQAIKALEYYGIYEEVLPKLVYGESIAQTNQFITTQAVDMGFTSGSTVVGLKIKQNGKWTEIDPESYDPIRQGIVILKHAENGRLSEAQKFFDFMFSETAQNVLKEHGYIVPDKDRNGINKSECKSKLKNIDQ